MKIGVIVPLSSYKEEFKKLRELGIGVCQFNTWNNSAELTEELALDVKALDENGMEIDLKEDYDADDNFVPESRAFQNVNDAESAEGYNVDSDSEANDVFIRDAESDDYGDYDDEFSSDFEDSFMMDTGDDLEDYD